MEEAGEELAWWLRYDTHRDFNTADDVSQKIFNFTLPPEDSEDEWPRRNGLKRLLDNVVDAITVTYLTENANKALHRLSVSFGVSRASCSFKYENTAAIQSAGWLHFETWRRLWKEHMRMIILRHHDLTKLEAAIVGSVPSVMEDTEMLNAL